MILIYNKLIILYNKHIIKDDNIKKIKNKSANKDNINKSKYSKNNTAINKDNYYTINSNKEKMNKTDDKDIIQSSKIKLNKIKQKNYNTSKMIDSPNNRKYHSLLKSDSSINKYSNNENKNKCFIKQNSLKNNDKNTILEKLHRVNLKKLIRTNSDITNEFKNNKRLIFNNKDNILLSNRNNKSNLNTIIKSRNEYILKKIKDFNNSKKKANTFLYTKHYGDPTRCPVCQSMEIKAQYSENINRLYPGHKCKEKNRDIINEDIRAMSNYSFMNNICLPSIKAHEEKKNSKKNKIIKLFSSKNYFNKDEYECSPDNLRNKFTFDILSNRFKRKHKFEIIDFPVINNYFNS